MLCRSRPFHSRFASSLPGCRGRRSYDARYSSLGAPSFASVSIRHRQRYDRRAWLCLSSRLTSASELRVQRPNPREQKHRFLKATGHHLRPTQNETRCLNAPDAMRRDAIRAVNAKRSLAAYVRLSKKLSAFLVAFTDYERRIVVSLLSPPRSSLPIGSPPFPVSFYFFAFRVVSDAWNTWPTTSQRTSTETRRRVVRDGTPRFEPRVADSKPFVEFAVARRRIGRG